MLSNSPSAVMVRWRSHELGECSPRCSLVEYVLDGFDQFCALFDQLMAAA
jgi:hypothetical protein